MKKTNEIIIVGVGETAEMAFEYFTKDSPFEVVAFAAEENYIKNRSQNAPKMFDLPIVALESLVHKYPPNRYRAFVAMAYGKLNHDRAKFYNFMKQSGYLLVSYLSSHAFIGENVKVGENCFILENNVIQRKVEIGDDVVLWSGNHIGHRSIIKNHVFLSSHVAISGYCKIGEYCFLGINSSVADNVKVAENCFIGGGVYLSHDTKPNEFYRSKPTVSERLSTKIIFGF